MTKEEGSDEALYMSMAYNKTPTSFVLFGKTYQLTWSKMRPELLVIRRDRRDAFPLVELGMLCEVETDKGTDQCDPNTWELLYPTPDMYRNGPYFFHEMKSFSIMLRTGSCRGGAFEMSVTCKSESFEFECVYFPPEELRGANVKAINALADKDGKGSKFDADELFSPVCDYYGNHWKPIGEPAYPDGMFSFLTPPFCYAIRKSSENRWHSLSIEPKAGDMRFSKFTTKPDAGGHVALRIEYAAPVPLAGCFRIPNAVLRLDANDAFDALRRQTEALIQKGDIKPLSRKTASWWQKPIVCGWREQTNRMQKDGLKAYDHCTQKTYEELTDYLERCEIPYGTLVIDAIWCLAEEDWRVDQRKWPDMRGFIDKLHEKGKHVLLWVCPNCGHLPDDEALICSEVMPELIDPDAAQHRSADNPVKRLVDPLSPAYRRRVFSCLHAMLSDEKGCLNADGLKLDYTGGMPSGYIVRCTEPLYGYSYLAAQYKLYHDAAKAAKPDCLLEFQVSNPYMAEYYDMTRLNDFLISPGLGMANGMMTDRMKIATSTNLGALIDVDGIRGPSYIRYSSRIGIPAIYLGIDDFRREADYIDAARTTFRQWNDRF